MRRYQRRLPHWDTTENPMFVTFCLAGSLPSSRVFPPACLTSGKAFLAMDRLLDTCTCGPAYLRVPEIAAIVAGAIQHGAGVLRRYDLHTYVVMPNHVHLLVTPHVPATKWLGSLKGFTAHEANRVLNTSGPFWQDESYDRLVQSAGEYQSIQAYIERNPVIASLAASPGRYPWLCHHPIKTPASPASLH